MAMTKCKECKQEVSDRAKVCPHCGVKNPGMTAMQMVMTFAVIVVLFWWFVWPDADNAEAGVLTQEQLGDAWPFTVAEGAVDCVSGGAAVFRSDGVTYQLNGTARAKGYEPIDSIWKENPALPGTRINLGPILDAALKQCD
tara:strand:+ start:22190 stop:22612 length:423 start_codon:yes stop_codon:yes gene_type:complete